MDVKTVNRSSFAMTVGNLICKHQYTHGLVHYTPSVWSKPIEDTLKGEYLDNCSEKFGFSHQTAFNMRHKFLLALQDFLNQDSVTPSGVSEFDETFVLESNKETNFPLILQENRGGMEPDPPAEGFPVNGSLYVLVYRETESQ